MTDYLNPNKIKFIKDWKEHLKSRKKLEFHKGAGDFYFVWNSFKHGQPTAWVWGFYTPSQAGLEDLLISGAAFEIRVNGFSLVKARGF